MDNARGTARARAAFRHQRAPAQAAHKVRIGTVTARQPIARNNIPDNCNPVNTAC
jgi:hypothetical protein